MNAILINLLSEQTTANILILGVAFILFFFFLRREFRYDNKTHLELIKSELKPIKELLANHITDTNKKIDRLTEHFDKLSDRLDKQSDQFNRFYEALLKENIKK